MNTKLLMSASAVVLGAFGLLLSFMPEEILAYTDTTPAMSFSIVLQLLGAVYFGFAMLNWMAKGNLIGGIYSRPVAIGNLAHFMIGGLALLKAAYKYPDLPALWAIGAVYALLALFFGKVVFTHPVKSTGTTAAKI